MDACEREKKKRYTPETLDWTQMDTQMAANYLCGSSLIVGEMSDCVFELAVGNVLSERFRSICNTQKESRYIPFFAEANVQT